MVGMYSGFIGGFGPVEVGIFVLIVALAGGYWVYRNSRRRDDPIEWYWIIGIVALFLFGIIPGLIGIYLYLRTRQAYEPHESSSTAPAATGDWLLGGVILFGTLFGGSVLGTVFTEYGQSGLLGFGVGAVVIFLTFSYLFYGR